MSAVDSRAVPCGSTCESCLAAGRNRNEECDGRGSEANGGGREKRSVNARKKKDEAAGLMRQKAFGKFAPC